MKGATGTLTELGATWEWINKGIIPLREIILYGDFWLPTVKTMIPRFNPEDKESEGVIKRKKSRPKKIVDCIKVVYTPQEIVGILNRFFAKK